jgi:hypothetical protein
MQKGYAALAELQDITKFEIGGRGDYFALQSFFQFVGDAFYCFEDNLRKRSIS